MENPAFNAIFCYSFILNYVFYNSQLFFVEAIIHLRKTIFHIPNLRNINDSSHPKYVSEMKKSFRCPCSVLYSFFIGSLRHTYVQNIYHHKQEKKKGLQNKVFLSSTIYASLVTSWLCWRQYSSIVQSVSFLSHHVNGNIAAS